MSCPKGSTESLRLRQAVRGVGGLDGREHQRASSGRMHRRGVSPGLSGGSGWLVDQGLELVETGPNLARQKNRAFLLDLLTTVGRAPVARVSPGNQLLQVNH